MLRRAAAALAALLFLAPASAETLRVGMVSDAETFDPQRYTLSIEARMLGDMFQGLVDIDAQGRPIPGMAESWTMSEDGLTYTFKLRPGLVWSDGTPLTVDDIVAGYRRAFEPATAAQLADLAYAIKNARAVAEGQMPSDQLGVAAPDAQTIVITLDAPRLTFIQLSGQFPLFFPSPRHVMSAAGEGWTKPGTMVSNGAYVLAEWTPGEKIRLEKNPRYWNAANVAIDEIVFFPVEDAAAGLKRFRAGELDISSDFPLGQYEWLKQNLPAETLVSPVSNVFFLSINHRQPPFDDSRVRLALTLAIDRETIVKKIFYDMGSVPAYGIFPASIPNWHTPAEADFSGTPLVERQAMARDLLAQAGYGPDNPIDVRLNFAIAESNRRLAPALVNMWKEIGATVRVEFGDTASLFQMLREHSFDMAASSWNGFADPEFYIDLARGGADRNYGGWSNPEYDRLIAAAVVELDPAKRLELFRTADGIAMAEVALIPLTYGVSRNLVHTYVKGFETNALNAHPSKYLRIER